MITNATNKFVHQTKRKTTMYAKVRRLSTHYHDKWKTAARIRKCHSLGYLVVYITYLAINVLTVVQLFSQKKELTNTPSEKHVHTHNTIYFDTIIFWNIIHTLSLVPDMWAGSDMARISRTFCTLLASILQTTFWSIIFPNVFSKSLFVYEYMGCCVLFTLELIYRIAYTRARRLRTQRIIPNLPHVQVNIDSAAV